MRVGVTAMSPPPRTDQQVRKIIPKLLGGGCSGSKGHYERQRSDESQRVSVPHAATSRSAKVVDPSIVFKPTPGLSVRCAPRSRSTSLARTDRVAISSWFATGTPGGLDVLYPENRFERDVRTDGGAPCA